MTSAFSLGTPVPNYDVTVFAPDSNDAFRDWRDLNGAVLENWMRVMFDRNTRRQAVNIDAIKQIGYKQVLV